MKRKEFRDQVKKMSKPELQEKARALAEELMKLRFRKASGQLQQSHRVHELKIQLAQVKTAQNAKTVEVAKG